MRRLLLVSVSLLWSFGASAQVVEYYHVEALGSVRAITNQAGAVVEHHDYLPFGEEHAPSLTCPGGQSANCQRREFTGKERDTETGQDYFGARYYASRTARFTTIDPVYKWREKLLDPQRWNRYDYGRSNPLRYVDPDGRWPTSVHDEIVDEAFPGLSADERAVLQGASSDTDYVIQVNGRDPQDPENSFVHSMADGTHGQGAREAAQLTEAFVSAKEQEARGWQATYESAGGQGLSANALYHFGVGLHTVSDGTSPAHVGHQEWNGTSGVSNKAKGLAHLSKEARPSPGQLATAVEAERQAFRRTFGEARYREAIGETQQGH